jgi:hypothetical protein
VALLDDLPIAKDFGENQARPSNHPNTVLRRDALPEAAQSPRVRGEEMRKYVLQAMGVDR